MARSILRISEKLLSIVLVLVFLLVGGYSAYAIWDNSQVYIQAENVQESILRLKPTVTAEEKPSFEDLLAVNGDVCAWLTLPGTKIDYPVLQGGNNLDYINTDVYGNFALAGSIFLDSRNSKDFSDPYSLIYGHHMAHSEMFGDLDLYKNEKFFKENKTGTLLLPEGSVDLKIFACLVVDASEDEIFNPNRWAYGIKNFIPYVQKEAIHMDNDTLSQINSLLDGGENAKVLALSTCASEFTDARTIVLALMEEAQ